MNFCLGEMTKLRDALPPHNSDASIQKWYPGNDFLPGTHVRTQQCMRNISTSMWTSRDLMMNFPWRPLKVQNKQKYTKKWSFIFSEMPEISPETSRGKTKVKSVDIMVVKGSWPNYVTRWGGVGYHSWHPFRTPIFRSKTKVILEPHDHIHFHAPSPGGHFVYAQFSTGVPWIWFLTV